MELKKLIMLGLTCLGVAGTTAVALYGQNVTTIPGALVNAGATSKTKTFDVNSGVTAGASAEYPDYGYYIDAGTCDDGVTAHSKILIWDGEFTISSFCENGHFLESDAAFFAIGLNGIKSVSVTYRNISNDHPAISLWPSGTTDFYNDENCLAHYDVENFPNTHGEVSDTITLLESYEGTTAGCFLFECGGGIDIVTLTITWSC